MATPMKCLTVSPKIVSTLSPNIKSFGRALPLVRRLEYSPQKRNDISQQCRIRINGEDYQGESGAKRLLIINTPKKLSLLRNGLGDHRELTVLGRGSFGTVVKGIHKAIKVIKTRERLKEMNALGLRQHENVITIFDVIAKSESHAIVIMEYLENCRQLQALLDDDDATVEAGKMGLDIAKGIQFCHDAELMHLDLKPKNVLVSRDGVCKICDFGNSCTRDQLESFQHEGTVVYTAPEILAGGKPDFPSDIYSLGIVLWQLKHREVPYNKILDKFVVIYKVVKFGLRPCEGLDVENTYANLYRRCWSSNPEQRPSPARIIETLESLVC